MPAFGELDELDAAPRATSIFLDAFLPAPKWLAGGRRPARCDAPGARCGGFGVKDAASVNRCPNRMSERQCGARNRQWYLAHMNLAHVSDEELLAGVRRLTGHERTVLARLLAYLGEVEERRLDLQSACSSLFDFCVRRLGMSEDEACRRVAAARIVRRFPMALGMIARGEIHLTGLLLLRDHLTPERGEELLREAAGKSKSELQHLLAERFPRSDVMPTVQALTASPAAMSPSKAGSSSSDHPSRPRVEPLAPTRYRVEFTASAELKEKLDRAADLMRHANPSGELSAIVERALDALLAKLEKERLAKAKRQGQRRPSTRGGYVPRAVRREVFERDGERCTFVDESGRRCESRTWLELNHRIPRARGGPDDASNLAVVCRAHNRLAAEQQFGRQHMDRAAGRRPVGGPANDETKTRAATEGPPRLGDEHPTGMTENDERALDAGEPPVHPRQRGSDELVIGALCRMGFQVRQARRALRIVGERRPRPPTDGIATLLREALAVLAT